MSDAAYFSWQIVFKLFRRLNKDSIADWFIQLLIKIDTLKLRNILMSSLCF